MIRWRGVKKEEEKGFRVYKGRGFMHSFIQTLDADAGIWVYLLPKQKQKNNEEKTNKNNKAALNKGKAAAQRIGRKP